MKKYLRLAFVSLMFAVGCAAGFGVANYKPAQVAYAETSEVEPGVEEPEPEEPKTSWIEDKIVPIVSGFSVANVVGIIVSVATSFAKSRMDKALKEKVESQKAEIALLQGSLAFLSNEVKELIAAFAENKELVTRFQETANNILNAIEERNSDIVDVVKMKDTLNGLCNLVSKALALSDEAVKSGIAKDAQRLVLNITGGGVENGEE